MIVFVVSATFLFIIWVVLIHFYEDDPLSVYYFYSLFGKTLVADSIMYVCGFKEQSSGIVCGTDMLEKCSKAVSPIDPTGYVFVQIYGYGFCTIYEPLLYNDTSLLKNIPVKVKRSYNKNSDLTAVILEYVINIESKDNHTTARKRRRGIRVRSLNSASTQIFC